MVATGQPSSSQPSPPEPLRIRCIPVSLATGIHLGALFGAFAAVTLGAWNLASSAITVRRALLTQQQEIASITDVRDASSALAAIVLQRAATRPRSLSRETERQFASAAQSLADRMSAADDRLDAGTERASLRKGSEDVLACASSLNDLLSRDDEHESLHASIAAIAASEGGLRDLARHAVQRRHDEAAQRFDATAAETTTALLRTLVLVSGLFLISLLALAVDTIVRHTGLRRLRIAIDSLVHDGVERKITVRGAGPIARLAGSIRNLTDRFDQSEANSSRQVKRLTKEIDDLRQREQRLRHDALHDPLTGLSNRSLLIQNLDQCIERAKRSRAHRFALLFLDLDRFKVINDSLGHNVGDELLKQAAARLKESVRGVDSVVRIEDETTARLGGDEFAILLDGISNPGRAVLVAERIQALLSKPFQVGSHELAVNTSVGIAIGGAETPGGAELLRDADTAMYRAKTAGGARFAVFDDLMHAEVKQRLQMENDLRKAVEEQQFEIRYQPIVSLDSGRVCAFEALIRWSHPDGELISPSSFIPMAEETGLVVPIGQWVLQTACRQIREWQKKLGNNHDLGISVNVSPRQVADMNLVEGVRRTLHDTGLDARHLRLEITESMLMADSYSPEEVFRNLKSLGLQLHMDDFGTGYSSLSCLHRFPLDVLKIDREFLRTINDDRDYGAVIRAVMTLAHSLKMRVTAEGLETPEQLALVHSLGCEFGQGYLFAEPLTPADAWDLLCSQSLSIRRRIA